MGVGDYQENTICYLIVAHLQNFLDNLILRGIHYIFPITLHSKSKDVYLQYKWRIYNPIFFCNDEYTFVFVFYLSSLSLSCIPFFLSPLFSHRAKAQLIDGKRIANDIYDELSKQVQDMVTAGRRVPHLVLVRVGGDPASGSYVKNKKKAADKIGNFLLQNQFSNIFAYMCLFYSFILI